jgi:voltage-gated potassium channel Kch
MNRIQRCLAVLAGLGGTLIVLAAAGPAVFAALPPRGPAPASSRPLLSSRPHPPAWFKHPHLPPGHIFHQPVHQPLVPVPGRAVVIGGMPGWQIALIAAGAALAAAVVAVLLDRAHAARKVHAATG